MKKEVEVFDEDKESLALRIMLKNKYEMNEGVYSKFNDLYETKLRPEMDTVLKEHRERVI